MPPRGNIRRTVQVPRAGVAPARAQPLTLRVQFRVAPAPDTTSQNLAIPIGQALVRGPGQRADQRVPAPAGTVEIRRATAGQPYRIAALGTSYTIVPELPARRNAATFAATIWQSGLFRHAASIEARLVVEERALTNGLRWAARVHRRRPQPAAVARLRRALNRATSPLRAQSLRRVDGGWRQRMDAALTRIANAAAALRGFQTARGRPTLQVLAEARACVSTLVPRVRSALGYLYRERGMNLLEAKGTLEHDLVIGLRMLGYLPTRATSIDLVALDRALLRFAGDQQVNPWGYYAFDHKWKADGAIEAKWIPAAAQARNSGFASQMRAARTALLTALANALDAQVGPRVCFRRIVPVEFCRIVTARPDSATPYVDDALWNRGNHGAFQTGVGAGKIIRVGYERRDLATRNVKLWATASHAQLQRVAALRDSVVKVAARARAVDGVGTVELRFGSTAGAVVGQLAVQTYTVISLPVHLHHGGGGRAARNALAACNAIMALSGIVFDIRRETNHRPRGRWVDNGARDAFTELRVENRDGSEHARWLRLVALEARRRHPPRIALFAVDKIRYQEGSQDMGTLGVADFVREPVWRSDQDVPAVLLWRMSRRIVVVATDSSPHVLASTLAHELGHYLGLPHPRDSEAGDVASETRAARSLMFHSSGFSADVCGALRSFLARDSGAIRAEDATNGFMLGHTPGRSGAGAEERSECSTMRRVALMIKGALRYWGLDESSRAY